MRSFRRSTEARGYTLMELVIAAMLSVLIIAGLYVVQAGHARVFRGQEQASQAQTAVRFAMEIVRDDLELAGAMGVSNTADPAVNQKLYQIPMVGQIQAVSLVHNQGQVYDPDPVINKNIVAEPNKPSQAPDALTLVGNYTNTDEYWINNVKGVNVTLQNTGVSDPSEPFPADSATFSTIFTSDDSALARIRTPNKIHFTVIGGGTFASRNVTISDTMTQEEPCDGCQINVLNMIRYRVVPAVRSPLEPTLGNGLPYIENRADLVRDVVDWNNQGLASAPIRREIVAENVVDFQVWFLFNNNDAINQSGFPYADANTGGPPCNGGALGTGNCLIKNIRAAVVRLSVRTQREDSNFLIPQPPIVRRPLMWYEVDEKAPGAARVRTLVTQVVMPNIDYGL